MKKITKFLLAFSPTILLSASVANAQCTPGYTWTQPSSNVINFTNTSTPIIPNSTFFYWSFGDNQYGYNQNEVHTYSAPGTYIVCLMMYDSLSSCQASFCDSVTVWGNVLCNVSVSATVSSSATCSTCADGSAYANMYGGTAPYTYSWSDGQATQTATGLAAGSYTVCMTDANGCNACGTVNVPVNSCTAGFTWTQTSNNVITFTNTSTPIIPNSTVFSWSFGDQQYGWQQDPVHTYYAPGTYIVCVTMYDSLNNYCSSTFCDSITVTGNVICNVYTSATILQNATCSTCADGSASATMSGGTAPYTYSWSDGQTTQTATGLAPGSYTVCITDINGCMACDTLVMDTSACSILFTYSQTSNNPVQFNATVGSTSMMFIYWDFGDGNYGYGSLNPTNSYAQSGTYWVCATVSDSNNCSATFCDSVTVLGNPNPTACDANFVIYPDSVNTNVAWAYNLSTGGPNMTYIWSWGDNTFDYVAYPSHTYTATGTYQICLVVNDQANQCSDTMCQYIFVPRLSQQAAMAPYYVNVLPTGVQEQHQIEWSLFPNPATTELTIKTDYSLQGDKYQILDIAGRVVIAKTIDGNKIDVSSLDKGMYILQIENGKGGFSAQRFMKN